jgi:transcriptional regulator with XRE-family HTH domain
MDSEKTAGFEALNAGETIRKLLKDNGFSQDKAAQMADIRLGFLSRLIRGKRVLDLRLARDLATKWNLAPSEALQLERVSKPDGGGGRLKTVNDTNGYLRCLLGDFLREKRVLHGIKAKDLALNCKVKLPNWIQFEKGRSVPNPATVVRFAKFVPLSPNERVDLFRRLALGEKLHTGDTRLLADFFPKCSRGGGENCPDLKTAAQFLHRRRNIDQCQVAG